MSYTKFPMYRNGSIWSGGLYSATNELLQMFVHYISYISILQWELHNWTCVLLTRKNNPVLYQRSVLFGILKVNFKTARNKKGFWCFAVCETVILTLSLQVRDVDGVSPEQVMVPSIDLRNTDRSLWSVCRPSLFIVTSWCNKYNRRAHTTRTIS